MKPTYFSLFTVFFFSTFHRTTAASSYNYLILKTCQISSHRDPNINYDFCVSSLLSATKTHHRHHHHRLHHHRHHHHHRVNLRKLGLISIKLIRHNVTSTRQHINRLLKHKKMDGYKKLCLKDCLELYSDAADDLKKGRRDYKAKRYEDANIEIGSVIDASSTCEEGFEEKEGVVSPLTKGNNDAFQLSAIALSIINMLV